MIHPRDRVKIELNPLIEDDCIKLTDNHLEQLLKCPVNHVAIYPYYWLADRGSGSQNWNLRYPLSDNDPNLVKLAIEAKIPNIEVIAWTIKQVSRVNFPGYTQLGRAGCYNEYGDSCIANVIIQEKDTGRFNAMPEWFGVNLWGGSKWGASEFPLIASGKRGPQQQFPLLQGIRGRGVGISVHHR